VGVRRHPVAGARPIAGRWSSARGQIGLCPSARVDDRGRYAITLRAGRYALVPAPGRRNVVMVTPRWVWIEAGRVTTLDINGGNAMF